MFSLAQRIALSEFKRRHAQMIFSLAKLQKCTITLAQAESMVNGMVPLYLPIAEAEIIINLMRGYRFLLEKVEAKIFSADIQSFCDLHGLVAAGEDLEWGHLRGEGEEKQYIPGVRLLDGRLIRPIPTSEPEKIRGEILTVLTNFLNSDKQIEDGIRLFCALCVIQPFFDANKRTIFLFVNAILVDEGIKPLVLPLENLSGFQKAFEGIFGGNIEPITQLFLEENEKAYASLKLPDEAAASFNAET